MTNPKILTGYFCFPSALEDPRIFRLATHGPISLVPLLSQDQQIIYDCTLSTENRFREAFAPYPKITVKTLESKANGFINELINKQYQLNAAMAQMSLDQSNPDKVQSILSQGWTKIKNIAVLYLQSLEQSKSIWVDTTVLFEPGSELPDFFKSLSHEIICPFVELNESVLPKSDTSKASKQIPLFKNRRSYVMDIWLLGLSSNLAKRWYENVISRLDQDFMNPNYDIQYVALSIIQAAVDLEVIRLPLIHEDDPLPSGCFRVQQVKGAYIYKHQGYPGMVKLAAGSYKEKPVYTELQKMLDSSLEIRQEDIGHLALLCVEGYLKPWAYQPSVLARIPYDLQATSFIDGENYVSTHIKGKTEEIQQLAARLDLTLPVGSSELLLNKLNAPGIRDVIAEAYPQEKGIDPMHRTHTSS